MVNTTDKYGLRDKITFNTKLLQAVWNEGDGKWKLTLEQAGSLIEDVADVVLDASGILKYATIPPVVRYETDTGQSMEMARYRGHGFISRKTHS
jgi:cation diffusion facilitator CzcD-associated flavoprotein CzcO